MGRAREVVGKGGTRSFLTRLREAGKLTLSLAMFSGFLTNVWMVASSMLLKHSSILEITNLWRAVEQMWRVGSVGRTEGVSGTAIS